MRRTKASSTAPPSVARVRTRTEPGFHSMGTSTGLSPTLSSSSPDWKEGVRWTITASMLTFCWRFQSHAFQTFHCSWKGKPLSRTRGGSGRMCNLRRCFIGPEKTLFPRMTIQSCTFPFFRHGPIIMMATLCFTWGLKSK